MCRHDSICIIVLFAFISAPNAFGDAKELIEAAIVAHGGEAAVAKLKSVRIHVEGDAQFVAGQPAVPIILDDIWRMPDRYKTTSHLTLQGQKVRQTLCVNGKEGWAEMNGQVQPLPAQALKEMKEQKWAEDFDRLLPLRDKSLKLSQLEDAKVDDHPAACIKVEAERHRDVRLYFDKQTHLLVKREQEVLGDDGKPVLQSVVFCDFADKSGVKHWTKIRAYRDGKPFITAALKEIEVDRKPADADFERPAQPK